MKKTELGAHNPVPSKQRLRRAISQWCDALGPGQVATGPDVEARYGACTTGTTRKIPCALRPRTVADVQALVVIAAQQRTPLYPISTGHNWGYGAANPAVDDCVIVDLSSMTRLEVDPALGIAHVEPGVTQQQLYDFLLDRQYSLMVPVHGGGPSCSLVGNALERGYGITPHTDHFAAVTALEAVLPDGQRYRTPLSENGGALVDQCYKWGTGPYLDGIFTQGNFGIVTSMTIALASRPERVEAFFFGLERDDDLEEVVDRMRNLARSLPGILGSINVMNARRVLSMMSPYPIDHGSPNGIIPDERVAELARQQMVMPWMVVGALYGPKSVVRAARSVVKEVLRPTAKRLLFTAKPMLDIVKSSASLVPDNKLTRLRNFIDKTRMTLEILSGRPSEIALALAYWKHGPAPTEHHWLDPARDGCGLIWYCPLVPLLPDRVRQYVRTVDEVCRSHGIEPLITLTTLSERCLDSTVPLLFDARDPHQRARAHACYQALYTAGQQQGFLPYRAGVHAMDRFVDSNSSYWQLARRMKSAIDPHDIIAPGRYSILLDRPSDYAETS